jgi:hypothetical protein
MTKRTVSIPITTIGRIIMSWIGIKKMRAGFKISFASFTP